MDAEAVRRAWSHRTGEYSPDYYAYYGPNEASEAVRRHLDDHVGPDAAVLELGCSAGRHLAHLHDHGYRDLHGVDVNRDAVVVLAQHYPGLAEDGTFAVDAIEDALVEVESRRFDAVIAVETLQHLHPDSAWVFEEIARVVGEILVTVEVERPTGEDTDDGAMKLVDEGVPLYYRDWGTVFEPLGLEQVAGGELDRDVVRVFRRR